MRRMTFLFVSEDTYDPKEVHTYPGHDLQPPRKFFRATQSQPLHSLRLFFRVKCEKIQL